MHTHISATMRDLFRDRHARELAAAHPCAVDASPGVQCMALITHIALIGDCDDPVPACTSCAVRLTPVATSMYCLVVHDC